MLEVLTVLAFFGYIYYLKNYADLRTASEKEASAVADGIALYEKGRTEDALAFFEQRIAAKPKSAVAYLYRGLCYQQKGNPENALQDLKTSVSLDDNYYPTRLELGKLYLISGDTTLARAEFDRAAIMAEGIDPDVYEWRARALDTSGLETEAEIDRQEASKIREAISQAGQPLKKKAKFVDRRLIVSMLLTLVTSALVIMVIKDADAVHLPYLVAVFSAVSIGFAEPHKGWLVALVQCFLILGGYFLIVPAHEGAGRENLENFSLYGSVILTLAASFLGAFLKRALAMT
jgi:tetratricopeptide (TPR) repeat protein